MNMEFLKKINFDLDDGVNLFMINDFMRNQFYDRVLKRYVRDQYCTDIGFGTGLLSIMALKHGARHVRAFESDHNRYLLGCEIIDRLKLHDQIELINDRYHHHHHNPTPISFAEIVNGNLWGEGLWQCLPKAGSKDIFLPGTYFLELWVVEVPDAFAQGLLGTEKHNKQTTYSPAVDFFSPGVDIDQNFIDVVNQLSNKTSATRTEELPQGIVTFMRQRETDWGWIPYMRAVQAGKIVGGYSVDTWEPNKIDFEFTVPTAQWKNSTVLIVPRVGMQQDHDRMYLDTGSWGPAEYPVLLVRPEQNLTVNHTIRTSGITYKLEA